MSLMTSNSLLTDAMFSGKKNLQQAKSNNPFQVQANFSSEADQILFSASNKSKAKSHRFRSFVAALPVILASTFGVAAPILASAQPAAAQTTTANEVCIDDSTVVNTAGNVPQLNSTLLDTVVDLCSNPLLTPQTQAALQNTLNQLNQTDLTQIAIVVVPDSNAESLQRLGTDIFNQIGVGNDNDDDGALIIANASAIRENRSTGRINIVLGDHWNSSISDSQVVDILRANALPDILNQNYDAAVTKTLEALNVKLAQLQDRMNTPTTPTQPGEPSQNTEEEKQNLLMIFAIALGVIATLAALGGAGSGAKTFYTRRKPHAVEVNELLSSIGSDKKVNIFNVHTDNTVKALLEGSAPQAAMIDSQQLMQVLSEIFADPKQAVEKRAIYIAKGLNHPSETVRAAMVSSLNESRNATNETETFKAFMSRFGEEKESSVLKALELPLVDMVTEENAWQFEETITNPLPDVRRTGIRVLNKFFNPDPKEGTMPQFFNLLESDSEPSIIKVLQDSIAERTKADYTDLFVEKLANQNQHVEQSAVRSLGEISDPETFNHLLNQYKADANKVDSGSDPTLQEDFVKSLKSTVRKNHLEMVYPGLTDEVASVEAMAITLLAHLDDAESVATLFDYLKSTKSRYAEQAVQIIIDAVNNESRPLLKEQLVSKGEHDELSRQTAVKALTHLYETDDLPVIIKALESEESQVVQKEMHQSIVKYGDKQDAYNILTGELAQNENDLVLLAAADAMERYPTLEALKPLYKTLDERGDKLSKTVVDTLNDNILYMAKDTGSLSFLLEQETSTNPRVQNVSEAGIINMISVWDASTNYDDDPVLETVRKLSAHKNNDIAKEGAETLKNFIDRKVAEVKKTGETDDFGNGQYFEKCAVPAALAALVKRAEGKKDTIIVETAKTAIERLRTRRDQHEVASATQLAQAADSDEDRSEQALNAARSASSSSSAQQQLNTAESALSSAQGRLQQLTTLKQYAIRPDAIDPYCRKAASEIRDAEQQVDQIDAIEKRLRQAECIAAARECASDANSYARQANSAESSARSSSSSSSARSYARQADGYADSAASKANEIRSIMNRAVFPSELNSYLSDAESAASSARSSARSADSHADRLHAAEVEAARIKAAKEAAERAERAREAAERAREASERASRSNGYGGGSSSGRGGGI